MFWDLLPYYGDQAKTGYEKINQTSLDVMEKTLYLTSVSCIEGALHGLGHWHDEFPKKVETIIDKFIASGKLPEELREYASKARDGNLF